MSAATSSLHALPAPVTARVCVPDTEIDVLFLIAQYLRDLGLCTTVVALLRESGLDPFWLCGPSREVALLREWVLQGEWQRVRALLTPLRVVLSDASYAVALALVEKQARMEEFFMNRTTTKRRREILDEIQSHENHPSGRLTKQELQRCLRVLKADTQSDTGREWSLDEARLACFESLVPLFRDAISDDDDESKYQRMPRRQLVALLNDALLFQGHSQQHPTDLISLTPHSSPSFPSSESDAHAPVDSTASSLRLAEPVERSKMESRDVLSQSVSSLRLNDGFQTSGSSREAAGGGSSRDRRKQNPLVMSMDFSAHRTSSQIRSRSYYTHDEQSSNSGVHQIPEDDESDGEKQVPPSEEASVHLDVATQTDCVAAREVAIEANEEETCSMCSSRASASTVHAMDPQKGDSVLHGESPVSSNQSWHEDVSVAKSTASLPPTHLSDPPLQAWSVSHHNQLSAKLHESKSSRKSSMIRDLPHEKQVATPDPEHDSSSEDHGEEQDDEDREQEDDDEQDEEQDDTEHDSNDPADPEHGDRDHDQPAPLLTYAQLTLDSVVRGHVVAQVREAQAIRALDISPDGSEMVIGTNARALRVFDLSDPLAIAAAAVSASSHSSFLPLLPVSMERHKHHASAIYVAAYNHVEPDHASPLIATGAAESSIKVLSRWTQQELWIRGHTGKCRALTFASSRLLCSAASGDLLIRAWDIDRGSSGSSAATCVQRFDGHVGEIQALAVSSDRRCFVSSSMDRTVRLWDSRTAQCARVLARTGSPAFTLAFQPSTVSANVLATGHQDGTVSLWDLRSSLSRQLATIAHHQDECRAVSWSPDGRWLLSASFDGTLCLMETTGGEQLSAVASLHQHDDKVLQAQWHPTQPAIITTGADKLIKLWGFAG